MKREVEALIVGLLGQNTAAAARRIALCRRLKPSSFDWAYVGFVAAEQDADPAVLRRLFGFYEKRDASGDLRGYRHVPAPQPEHFANDNADQLVAVALSKWMELTKC